MRRLGKRSDVTAAHDGEGGEGVFDHACDGECLDYGTEMVLLQCDLQVCQGTNDFGG